MKIVYKASDGREFLTEQDCQNYETELEKRVALCDQNAEVYAKSLLDYCKAFGNTCKGCPFDKGGCRIGIPISWEV